MSTNFPKIEQTVDDRSGIGTSDAASVAGTTVALVCPTPKGKANYWTRYDSLEAFLAKTGDVGLFSETVTQAYDMIVKILSNRGSVVHLRPIQSDAALAHATVGVAVKTVQVDKYYIGDNELKLVPNIVSDIGYSLVAGETTYTTVADAMAAGAVLTTETQFIHKMITRQYPASFDPENAQSMLKPTEESVITGYADKLIGETLPDGSKFFPLFTMYATGPGTSYNGIVAAIEGSDVLDSENPYAKLYNLTVYQNTESSTKILFGPMKFSFDPGMTIAKAIGSKASGFDSSISLYLTNMMARYQPNSDVGIYVHDMGISSYVTAIGGEAAGISAAKSDLIFFSETDENMNLGIRDAYIPYNGTSQLLEDAVVAETTLRMVPFDIAPGSSILVGAYIYDVEAVNMSTGQVTLSSETAVQLAHPAGTVVTVVEDEAFVVKPFTVTAFDTPVSAITVNPAFDANGESFFYLGAAQIVSNTGDSVDISITDITGTRITVSPQITVATGSTMVLKQLQTRYATISNGGPFKLSGGTNGTQIVSDDLLLINAYSGLMDGRIFKESEFEIDLLMTSGESSSVKQSILGLGQALRVPRIIDMGRCLDVATLKASSQILNDGSPYTYCVCGSYKSLLANGIRTVTSTHGLAAIIPANDITNGRHINFCGLKRGVFSDIYAASSIDYMPSTDAEKTELMRYRINYLDSQRGVIHVATDRSAQVAQTVLADFSNSRTLVDLLRGVKKLFIPQLQEYPTPVNMKNMQSMLDSYLVNNWSNVAKSIRGTVYKNDYSEINKQIYCRIVVEYWRALINITQEIVLI